MSGRNTFLRFTLVLLLPVSCATAQSAGGLTPLQMMKMRAVRSVHPSADGSKIAFVRSEPRLPGDEAGAAWSNLWIIPAEGGDERLLIGGKRKVEGVSFRPDGRQITFLDKREGAPHNEVYGLPMDGGEAVRITTTEHGVAGYQWSPDGRFIAYTVSDPPPKERDEAQKAGFKQVVVDESWTHTSLHLYDVEAKTSRRLTEGKSVMSFEWSPDSRTIAAGLAPRPLVDDSYMFTRLHRIDVEKGTVEPLVDNPGKLGHYAWSPDGGRLAYISAADVRDPHPGMIYVVDAADRSVRCLTEGWEGQAHHLQWLNSTTLLCSISEGVVTTLAELDVTGGQFTRRPADRLAMRSFAMSQSMKTVAVAASRPFHPPEVYVWNDGWRRLTSSNPWLGDVELGTQEVVRYPARDGLEIEGMLIHPVGESPGTRHPLVIVAHGGPEAHFDDGWMTSYGNLGQLLAAKGYCSWYPNYRASTGRGVKFAKLDHGDPMGREFEDHLDAIEHFDQSGLIDRTRVGIIGGSYGGYTAAWAATRHSEHFAAAVSFVPFVDIRTKWYTSDISWEFFYVHYQEKWPHEQLELLRERSPLTYAPQCRTPILLCGGAADTRVHPSQPFMLYRAVKTATTTPVRYVQYPGEGHGNQMNVYQLDFCLRALEWFDHYLGPGDHRGDPPPPMDLDYSTWLGKQPG